MCGTAAQRSCAIAMEDAIYGESGQAEEGWRMLVEVLRSSPAAMTDQRFPEGFDTMDLQEASMLLAALLRHRPWSRS